MWERKRAEREWAMRREKSKVECLMSLHRRAQRNIKNI